MPSSAAERRQATLALIAVVVIAPGCGKDAGRARAGPQWILRPPGTLRMGAPPTESCRGKQELRPRDVDIGHGLEVATHEVTQAQWARVMDTSPSFHRVGGEHHPVEMVTWTQAADFARRPSRLTHAVAIPARKRTGSTSSMT